MWVSTRLIGLDRRAHITPALKQLQCTLVASSIQTTIQNCYTHAPDLVLPSVYLVNLVSFTVHVRCGRTTPTFHSDKGSSFSSYSHILWKTSVFNHPPVCVEQLLLPSSLRLVDSHKEFRRQLKTYCFNIAFSISPHFIHHY